jgi:hypothetical protein
MLDIESEKHLSLSASLMIPEERRWHHERWVMSRANIKGK